MGKTLAEKPKMPKFKKDCIHTIIAVLLYIIIGHCIPYREPMTGQGMQLVGIFVMTVYLWTTVSTFWPSVLAVFMCGTTGYCTGTVALKECFGHGMTVFVAFMFMFNVAMNESGFSRRIALFFVTRKFVKGKPWLIMFMLMFSVWFVSAFVTSSAVYAMFLSIGEEMLKMTGCDTDEDDLPDAARQLQQVYPNLLQLVYDNARTRAARADFTRETAAARAPMALFEELFALQNGVEMTKPQRELLSGMMERIWEDEA